MGDRKAQEFWDRMWPGGKHKLFPSAKVDDPHLVDQLSSDVEAAGGNFDAQLFARYGQCVGRVLQRVTDEFPHPVDGLDEAERKHWLKFALRRGVPGHDAAVTPIIDSDYLVISLFFVAHALQYADRHNRSDLQALWQKVADIANHVDDQHQGDPPASRFELAASSLASGGAAK
jgi:hypothetical protein